MKNMFYIFNSLVDWWRIVLFRINNPIQLVIHVMIRTPQLNEKQQHSIITLRHEGQTIQNVWRILNVSSAVTKTIKHWWRLSWGPPKEMKTKMVEWWMRSCDRYCSAYFFTWSCHGHRNYVTNTHTHTHLCCVSVITDTEWTVWTDKLGFFTVIDDVSESWQYACQSTLHNNKKQYFMS